MYKSAKNNKAIWRYIGELSQTGDPTVHWEYSTSYISVVEDKIVTPRSKHIDIPVRFLK